MDSNNRVYSTSKIKIKQSQDNDGNGKRSAKIFFVETVENRDAKDKTVNHKENGNGSDYSAGQKKRNSNQQKSKKYKKARDSDSGSHLQNHGRKYSTREKSKKSRPGPEMPGQSQGIEIKVAPAKKKHLTLRRKRKPQPEILTRKRSESVRALNVSELDSGIPTSNSQTTLLKNRSVRFTDVDEFEEYENQQFFRNSAGELNSQRDSKESDDSKNSKSSKISLDSKFLKKTFSKGKKYLKRSLSGAVDNHGDHHDGDVEKVRSNQNSRSKFSRTTKNWSLDSDGLRGIS